MMPLIAKKLKILIDSEKFIELIVSKIHSKKTFHHQEYENKVFKDCPCKEEGAIMVSFGCHLFSFTKAAP